MTGDTSLAPDASCKLEVVCSSRDALVLKEMPELQEITKRRTLSEVSSVMYCEALAFVAAQLHAAKCSSEIQML